VEFVRNKLTLNNVFVMADRKVDETVRVRGAAVSRGCAAVAR